MILDPGIEIEYLIDGRNRRIGKKVNGTLVQGFVYDDQLRIVAELDGQNNVVSRFIYADHINVPEIVVKGGRTYRILLDHLGSPRYVIDTQTGEIVQEMQYDAWGNVVYDSNPGFQPFGFAGGLYDPQTRLVRFGARDYDPQVGRWTSKDPGLTSLRRGNLFGYCRNSPGKWLDPDGYREIPPERPDLPGCLCALRLALRLRSVIAPFKLDDKFAHCLVACELALVCGRDGAYCMAWRKEELDFFGPGTFDPEDVHADLDGLRCADEVRWSRIVPPIAGCPQTCWSCCCKKGHSPRRQ